MNTQPAGILKQITEAIADEYISPDNPMTIRDKQLRTLLEVVTADFAAKLRDCTNGKFPNTGDNGVLMTFHRNAVPLTDDDNLAAEGIPDEAGTFYDSPDIKDLLKNPELPLPEDVIEYIQLRVATTRLGIPRKSDYDLYKKLEAKGKLRFGHPKLGLIKADAMVVATCHDGKWTTPMVVPYADLGLSPNMQALHYGSAEFEGMTAQIGKDGNVYIFAMKEHYERYRSGAVKQGIEYVTFEVFRDSVIKAVQQNARFMPKAKDGRMYIRQHAADMGPQMKVGNSRISGFFIEVTPIGSVGAYFGKRKKVKAGENTPMKVLGIPDNKVRSAKGQGSVKGVGNYSHTPPVIDAVRRLNLAKPGEKAIHPDGVLYLDRMVEGLDRKSDGFRSARICETNASNTIFIQNLADNKYRIVAPTLSHGDILPGNTRMLILAKAEELGWEVEERDVTIGELMDGKFDSAMNCGTAAMISPFDAIYLLHINERTLEQDSDPSVPKVSAELGETLIQIRDQAAVDKEPTPKPVQILLKKLLAVKAGASGEEDKARYLTQVPGLRAKNQTSTSLHGRIYVRASKPQVNNR